MRNAKQTKKKYKRYLIQVRQILKQKVKTVCLLEQKKQHYKAYKCLSDRKNTHFTLDNKLKIYIKSD